MSKIVVIGAIAGVLLVFTFIGIFLWQQSQVSPPVEQQASEQAPSPLTPSLSPEVLDTSNWQTYRNDEFGFEVKLPLNVQSKDNAQDEWWILAYDKGDIPIYAAEFALGFVRNEQISERDKMLYQQLESSPVGYKIGDEYISIIKREDIELDSCIATQFFMRAGPAENYTTDCKYRNGRIRFSATFRQDAPELAKEQTKETYDQILSTFRFVE